MTDVTEQKPSLEQIVVDAVAAAGVEYVGYELVGGAEGGRILRVYIDSPNGVTVEACKLVSRQIDMSMEIVEPPLITGNYHLEVSSPGVQRPLFTFEHYQRFVGQQVQVKLLPTVESKARRRYLGELIAAEDQTITIQCEDEDEVVNLPFSQIESGKLKVDWSELLKAAKSKKDK